MRIYSEVAMEKAMTRQEVILRAYAKKLYYSYKTEKIYIYWMRQYFHFHILRHPKEMGAAEVEAFDLSCRQARGF